MNKNQPTSKFYWLHWAWEADDGTICVKGSVYTADTHESVVFAIGRDHPEYAFWDWLMDRPDYERILDESDLAAAKEVFTLESGLA